MSSESEMRHLSERKEFKDTKKNLPLGKSIYDDDDLPSIKNTGKIKSELEPLVEAVKEETVTVNDSIATETEPRLPEEPTKPEAVTEEKMPSVKAEKKPVKRGRKPAVAKNKEELKQQELPLEDKITEEETKEKEAAENTEASVKKKPGRKPRKLKKALKEESTV